MRLGAREFAACMLASALGGSCAQRPPEEGLENSLASMGSVPCLQGPAARAYVEDLWHEMQDEWHVPRDVPPDQRVSVRIEFDAEGLPEQPLVTSATNEALQSSVLAAIEHMSLPAPPEDVRSCLAYQAMTADFRNPQRR
jgi:TonB C terminal